MSRPFRAFFVRIGGLFAGGRRDRELADELASHLQLHIDDLVRSGVPIDQARRIALLKFGAIEAVKDEYRDRRGLPFLESLWSDVRFAARTLRRTPAFTLVACLTLALGIGGTTAIFSAVNPVLFEPLPYPSSHRLVNVWSRGNDGSRFLQAFGTYRELLARSGSLESAAVLRSVQLTLTGTDESERLEAQRVSDAYFRVLGVAPAIGRDFQPADDVRNGPRVAILGDGLWRRRFGADETIVGRQIQLDGIGVTVIGVMPKTFENVLAPSVDVWVPLQYDMALGSAWGRHLSLIARLHPGTGLDAARADLDAIARAPVADFPRPPHASLAAGLVVSAMSDDVMSAVRPAFASVLGAALLLLTITCVNVANLPPAARRSVREPAELVPETVVEGRAGRLREAHLGVLEPDLELLPRCERADGAPVGGHVHVVAARAVQDVEDVVGRDDKRARRERMRRDEGDDEPLHAPGEHRPAVGEVVARRAGRRGGNETVAAHLAEAVARDRVAQFSDSPVHAAVERDVVDADLLRTADVRRQRGHLQDLEVARDEALDPGSSSPWSTVERNRSRRS